MQRELASRFLATLLLIAACWAPTRVARAAERPGPDAASSRPDDLWPDADPYPDLSKISVEWLGDGFTKVVGRPGAVPGRGPIMAVCANSGAAAAVLAGDDGSFEARVAALPASWIVVKYDPTSTSFSDSRWIRPPPSDHMALGNAMSLGNSAPGVWLRVAPPASARASGSAFALSAAAGREGVDVHWTGKTTGTFAAGRSVAIEGAVSVFVSTEGSSGLEGKRMRFDASLSRLFDEAGRARMDTGFYFSNVLTPTGLPVQTRAAHVFEAPGLTAGPLAQKASGRYSAPFRWNLPIPPAAPAGTYAWCIRARELEGAARLKAQREVRQEIMTRGLSCLPPFRLGRPARPRLTWTLLTDVPGADGSRGVVAREDRGDFELASGVVTQSSVYIVPRVSRLDGRPLTYRLEPYLPMVSQGDRLVPNPPPVAFRFPSGSLKARIRRPDGKTEVLGPAPFVGLRSRAPATSAGFPINAGSGALADVAQLTTGSRLFDYRFPLYGRYEIELSGEVLDVHGASYAGGGTYTVFVAERLDLEPATLAMTPLQAGDSLNPALTVLPGVPAEVEVSVRHFRFSDPRRVDRWSYKGKANRFGVYAPKLGEPRPRMSEPGEFIVESTARYLDPQGVLWMGASRWGQVVETPGAPLLARGQRGRVRTQNSRASLWFYSSRTTDGGHLRYPYASGDVVWQSDDDSLIPAITVQDREGLVRKTLFELMEKDPKVPKTFDWDGDLEDRDRFGELPLLLSARGLLPPAAAPDAVRVSGYYYAGAERPGERVREIVADDQGVQTHGYWFFGEPYAMQAGIGISGDLANDFKFLYGGAVFRDADAGVQRYGIYGALWLRLPDGDLLSGRIFPPFNGRHGGPSGGPLMTLAGKEIDGFVVPLAARPGTILETGDVFSLSAAVAPALPASIAAVVTAPDGSERRIAGRANAVGYFYRPDQDFVATAPGRYRVRLTATFDVETSAGTMERPPTGSVLGAAEDGFEVYVVERGAPLLGTPLPARSVARDAESIPLPVEAFTTSSATLHYTIAMPGFVLERGSLPAGRAGELAYRPLALKKAFPNIDVDPGKLGPADGGLADTVWVSALLEGPDGIRGRQFVLQGPDVYAP